MFDPKKIMEERELKDPIKVNNAREFPLNPDVPEGCHVISDVDDEWGYPVSVYTDVVYVTRQEPYEIPLHLIVLEPRKHFQELDPEKMKNRKWPCVVYVQGSAFHKQDLWDNIPRHIRLAEHGYVVAVVEYRHSDIAPFPAQMQDAKTAIRYMRKHAAKYHVDPDRIGLAGDSSGAHTALMAGFTIDREPDTDAYEGISSKVNCIVDSYGPTVFSLMNYCDSSQDHIQPDSPEGFEIGQKNVLEHPELVAAATPMNYLSPDIDTPPLLLIHGGRDMLVNFDQSALLYRYMKEMGKEVEFYKLEHANHGCNGFQSDRVLGIVLDFLGKYL